MCDAIGRRFRLRESGVSLFPYVELRAGPVTDPALLSPDQVARICGLSRRAVYRAITRGELPAARLCNRLRVRVEDLDAWINESIMRPPPPAPKVPHPARRARGSLLSMLHDVHKNGTTRR